MAIRTFSGEVELAELTNDHTHREVYALVREYMRCPEDSRHASLRLTVILAGMRSGLCEGMDLPCLTDKKIDVRKLQGTILQATLLRNLDAAGPGMRG